MEQLNIHSIYLPEFNQYLDKKIPGLCERLRSTESILYGSQVSYHYMKHYLKKDIKFTPEDLDICSMIQNKSAFSDYIKELEASEYKKPSIEHPRNDYICFVRSGKINNCPVDLTFFKSCGANDFTRPQDFLTTYTELPICLSYFDGILMHIINPEMLKTQTCKVGNLPILDRIIDADLNWEQFEEYQKKLRKLDLNSLISPEEDLLKIAQRVKKFTDRGFKIDLSNLSFF